MSIDRLIKHQGILKIIQVIKKEIVIIEMMEDINRKMIEDFQEQE